MHQAAHYSKSISSHAYNLCARNVLVQSYTSGPRAELPYATDVQQWTLHTYNAYALQQCPILPWYLLPHTSYSTLFEPRLGIPVYVTSTDSTDTSSCSGNGDANSSKSSTATTTNRKKSRSKSSKKRDKTYSAADSTDAKQSSNSDGNIDNDSDSFGKGFHTLKYDEGYDIIEKDSNDALYIRYLLPHILMIWRTLSAQSVYSSSDDSTVQQSSVTHAVIASTRSSSSTYCVLSTVNNDSTLAVACMAAAFGTLRSSTLAPSDCNIDSRSSGDACADIAGSSNSADTEQVPTDYKLQAPLMAAPIGDDICCSWLSVNSIVTDSVSRGTDISSTGKRPFEGAILLAQRGDCQFAEKARIAAAGGAAALIIVDSASAPENDAMFVMHGFDSESAARSNTALRKRCARKLHSNQHYCAGVLDSSSSSSSGAAVSIPVVLVSNSAGVALQQQLQQQRDLQLQLSVTTLPYAEFNRS
eukprot:14911-Heterococcus_DN1.PRE.1